MFAQQVCGGQHSRKPSPDVDVARHVHEVAHVLPGARLEGHHVTRGLRPARPELALRPASVRTAMTNKSTGRGHSMLLI